ncbi:RCC1 domain-containing protein [Paenibacillus dokdonensis]|uniref:RCC1 domain-containing protein n=1 Tax=Paenibacillus dokdonensis TaxID=2567944 RepID=UPI003D29BDA0
MIHFYPKVSISRADSVAQLSVTEVSAAEDHFLALMSDGTVMAMGCNQYGQLGNNTSTTGQVASYVVTDEGEDHLSNIKAISAGNFHNLALDEQGQVWAWGDHRKGQLGIGHLNTMSSIPAAVQIKFPHHAKIAAIAAGAEFSLALDEEGQVWAWGDHEEGQLGTGYHCAQMQYSPVRVETEQGPLNGIRSISAGLYHSLALDEEGQIWGWGANWEGALGFERGIHADFLLEDTVSTKDFYALIDHMTEHDAQNMIWMLARPVTDAGDIFTGISAGFMQSQALKADGSGWVWGYMEDQTNDAGRMVNGERLESRAGSTETKVHGGNKSQAYGDYFPPRNGSKWRLILCGDEPDIEAYPSPYVPLQISESVDFGTNGLGYFRAGRSRYMTEWVLGKSMVHLCGLMYPEYNRLNLSSELYQWRERTAVESSRTSNHRGNGA